MHGRPHIRSPCRATAHTVQRERRGRGVNCSAARLVSSPPTETTEPCPRDLIESVHVQAQLQNDTTLRTLLSVYLPQHTLVSQAIKAQFNEGRTPHQQPFPTPRLLLAALASTLLSSCELKRTSCSIATRWHHMTRHHRDEILCRRRRRLLPNALRLR